jgi:kynurenine formamidase
MRLVRAAAVSVAVLASEAGASAQSWQPPDPDQRCPSKWGAADERGAANHMKPELLLRAARLIKTGEAIELGRVLSSDMPLFTGRQFNIHSKRTNGPLGANKRYSNEELVVGEMGHVGTQFDMFSHQGIDGRLYNCVAIAEAGTRTGFSKLGVEKIGMLFTRGVLLDIAALKGVAMLPAGHEIAVAEIQAALARAKLTLQPGDAVLLHTGWGQLWGTDNARYAGNSPGIGVAAAEWLARQDVMLVGGDTAPVEISPNPDPQLNLPVHQVLLVVNGIFVLENLKLDELAAKGVGEFALVLQPLKLRGGTGSTVAPVAIR